MVVFRRKGVEETQALHRHGVNGVGYSLVKVARQTSINDYFAAFPLVSGRSSDEESQQQGGSSFEASHGRLQVRNTPETVRILNAQIVWWTLSL